MRILIVKSSSLGDIIHAYPAIGFIKAKFPHAQIDWVVEKSCASLVSSHPDVRRAIVLDTKQWRNALFSVQVQKDIVAFRRDLQQERYDVLFDLQGNVKSGFVTWLAKSPAKVGFSWPTVHEGPNVLFTNQRYSPPKGVNIRTDHLFLVQSYFRDFSSYEYPGITLNISAEDHRKVNDIAASFKGDENPLVMVCSGSNWRNKQLSDAALIEFLHRLVGYLNCTLLFTWGTEAEHDYVRNLQGHFCRSQILDKMSLPMLQNVIAKMDLVIAMDSLPLHLAGTTKTATFSVFGASLAAKFKPAGEQHGTLQGECPYGRTFEKRCPILRTCPTGACIRELSGEAIFQSFCRLRH